MSKVQRIPDVLVDRLEQEKEVSTMDKKILMKQKSVTAFDWKEGQVSVMKNCRKYFLMAVFACIMLAGTLFVGGTTRADAATRKGYIIGTSNVRVYSNTALTRGYGWIYPTDEVQVIVVTSRYTKVTYPVSGGRYKTGYIATGNILTATGGSTYTASGRFTTYRRDSTANTYGYVDRNDSVMILGTRGDFTQIKYPVSGGFKYAFSKTSDINTYVTGNNNRDLTSSNTSSESIIQKLVDYELSQLGTGDYRGNNNVKYNTWYYGREVSGSGYAWCMAFQAYCCYQITGSNNAIPKNVSCTSAVNTFKSRGQFHYSRYYGGNYTPKAGDVVYYTNGSRNSSCHVGMITSAPVNGYLQTVEGNIVCSDRNYKVVRFTKNAKRAINSSYVLGYATPNY